MAVAAPLRAGRGHNVPLSTFLEAELIDRREPFGAASHGSSVIAGLLTALERTLVFSGGKTAVDERRGAPSCELPGQVFPICWHIPNM
jgi:hypothetical protein